MDGTTHVEVSNARELHDAGRRLLEQAREIIDASGQTAESMERIGVLLREMTATGVLDELVSVRPAGRRAAVDMIAQHSDGSMLSFYAMQNWQSPPSNDVHWHNYWQILLVMRGTWPDTVWHEVDEREPRRAHEIVVDRREVIEEGELQTLGPREPHGWLAGDQRSTDHAVLLMWSGDAGGLPRTVLCPETGALTDEFGFLNPEPATPAFAAAHAGSTSSYNRY